MATRHVTFLVAGETYAVPVSHVREVIRWIPVTRLPHGAASVKGVINLRGEIVTLLDLRALLNLPPEAPTDRTCIVVVSIQRADARLQTGLIVDTALDVTQMAAKDIETKGDDAPVFAGDYVVGIARTKTGLTLLLDVERLVTDGLAPASLPS